MKSSKIFVIPEANIPFKESEQAAIVNYVKQGGNVVFISDHYNADRNLNRIDSSEAMNGYRRGAYEDMSKGMNAEEKKFYCNARCEKFRLVIYKLWRTFSI